MSGSIDGAGEALEEGLGHVVTVAAVEDFRVEVDRGLVGEGAEELLDELEGEAVDGIDADGRVELEVGAAAEVDDDAGERLVHGKVGGAVADEAAFFEDHFPRRAVFPGSLLMQYNLELVGRLAGELPVPAGASGWELQDVSNMKLRAFIPKGERLELEAKVLESGGDTATISIKSRRGKRPAGAATAILAAR